MSVSDASILFMNGFDDAAQADFDRSNELLSSQGPLKRRKTNKKRKTSSSLEDTSDSEDDDHASTSATTSAQDETRLKELMKDFRRNATKQNIAAFQRCWDCIETVTDKIIKDASEEKFGELCEFLKQDDPRFVFMGAIYAGLDVADNEISLQYLSDRLRFECTSHIAVVDPSCAKTVRQVMESVARQLAKVQLEIESLKLKEDAKDTQKEILQRLSRWERISSLRTTTQVSLRETKLIQRMDQRIPRKLGLPELMNMYKGLKRNIIVVFDSAENIDLKVLGRVVDILSGYHINNDDHPNVKVAMVMGLRSSSIQGVSGLLTRGETRRLKIRKFKAKKPLAIMDTIFRALFVNCKCPIQFGSKTITWLHDRFIGSNYSIIGFLRALKLATLDHFTRHSAAFLGIVEDTANAPPLKPNDVANIMKDLKSVQRHGKSDSSLSDYDQIMKWIHNQVVHRKQWPFVFRSIYIARGILDPTKRKDSARQVYVSLCASPKTFFAELTNRIRTFSLNILEQLVNKWGDELDGVFDSKPLQLAFKKKMEEELNEDPPSPSVTKSMKGSKKRQLELQIHSNLHQTNNTNSEARTLVLKWWEKHIVNFWDLRNGPLCELFFYNQRTYLKSALVGQPRTGLLETLRQNGSDHPTSILFQLMGQSRQKAHSLLALYQEFFVIVGEKYTKISEKEIMALFMQACSELQALGLCMPSFRAKNPSIKRGVF